MPPLPLKVKLGNLIKKGLRKNDLRQFHLAEHLQISTAAVSQMTKGKTSPSNVHLDKIFKLLHYNANQIFTMRELVAKIRSGMYDLQSPLNEFIKNARRESNLSLSKLARLSQITVSKLRVLETCLTAAPSNEQAITLAEILKFDVKDIQRLVDELPHQIANYEDAGNFSIQTPVLSLDDILKFNPVLEDIKTFVYHHCKQKFSKYKQYQDDSIDNNVFAVVTSGDKIDPPFPGSLDIIVAIGTLPETNDTVVVKFKNSDKLQLKRFLFEDNNIYLMPFNGTAVKQSSKANNLEWARKVLKVIISDL